MNDQELKQEITDIVSTCYKAPELVEYTLKISNTAIRRANLELVSKKTIENLIYELIKKYNQNILAMSKSDEAVKYMIEVWDEVCSFWRESPDHVQKKFIEAEIEIKERANA